MSIGIAWSPRMFATSRTTTVRRRSLDLRRFRSSLRPAAASSLAGVAGVAPTPHADR